MILPTAAAALLLGSAAAQSGYGANDSSLPIVDLGYELHQASNFNSTGRYYNFTDIRFAAPPTGENRFRAPLPPATNRSEVQKGGEKRQCPQALPAWFEIAAQFIPEYLMGQTVFNESSFNTSAGSSGGLPQDAPTVTEDCLFLDVLVPQDIFDNVGKGYGAPVLVWIYGGGYTEGSKDAFAPAGLLNRSEDSNEGGVIFVAINYRLGAFGWLSGPTFQADGTANAGLYDQRLALEWVQSNIAKFGGDPNRVTIVGESAGGGSIMHQITAFGGSQGCSPFQQAVPQSPGWLPVPSNQQQEQVFQTYLQLLNVSNIEEARKLPYAALQRANVIQVGSSPYGQFTYGPTVDGEFVPKQPGELLLHGQFDKSVRVMVGHNANEGLLFTSPFIQNNTDFVNFVSNVFPSIRAWPAVSEYITQDLYPNVLDGSLGYTNQIARTDLMVSEVVFTCNTFYLDKAYNNETYSYLFAVPPATHGQDIAFTFYPGQSSTTPVVPQIAIALQEYITNFVIYGRPNSPGVPFFNMYGENATVQTLNYTGITQMMDPAANARCNWWQKSLYI